MNKLIALGFENIVKNISIDSLIPSKILPKAVSKTPKYKQITQSISEIGLVEPIVVHPIDGELGKYIIVDGHVRYLALKNIDKPSVLCLIAKDDESYTYNKQINRLSGIQEHFMIMAAIDKGVSEERIAMVLNVNISTVRQKRNLLNGICPKVIKFIENISVPSETIRLLKRVKPKRQWEIIELLNNMGTYKADLAKAIVKRTPVELFKKAPRITKKSDRLFEVEHDIDTLIKETNRVKEKSGEDLVKLVTIGAYLSRLLDNKRVRNYISNNFPTELPKLDEVISAVQQ